MKPEEKALLREVLLRRSPSLAYLVDSLSVVPLTLEQREEMRLTLADEMLDVGLEENGEPNKLGRNLDDLIGLLGKL